MNTTIEYNIRYGVINPEYIGVITEPRDENYRFKEILKIAERLWLRCLYYEQTQRESVLHDMRDILSQIETDEDVILSQAVQRLELADTETNKN